MHTCTWSASAKLAVIFPGFSFVTGLVLCNHQRFFLFRDLLGFGKLLSIKKQCYCSFVVMCMGFTTNCQNMSRSKSLPPDIHPLHATTHTVALAGMCTSLILFTAKLPGTCSYGCTQSGVIQRLAQTGRKLHQNFHCHATCTVS